MRDVPKPLRRPGSSANAGSVIARNGGGWNRGP